MLAPSTHEPKNAFHSKYFWFRYLAGSQNPLVLRTASMTLNN